MKSKWWVVYDALQATSNHFSPISYRILKRNMSRLMYVSSSRIVRTSSSKIARSFCSSEELAKTAFYDLHNELGGKMVSFAGYSLPVQVVNCNVYAFFVSDSRADAGNLTSCVIIFFCHWTITVWGCWSFERALAHQSSVFCFPFRCVSYGTD